MERPPSSIMLAEAYGTFLLTFIGTTSITIANDPALFPAGATLGLGFIGLAFGIALLAGIASVGSISGAHFNPAVTLAICASGRLPWKKAPEYVVAQVIGATVAAVVVLALVGMNAASLAGVDLGSTLPNNSLPSPIFASVLAEIVGTMILAMTILGATDSDSSGISWGSSSIGFVLAAIIWALGAISGASLNPARSLGPALVSLLFDTGPMSYYWIYLVGPILGGLLAAQLYKLIYKRV
jgi:glycerol uptake facilitator protein